MKNHTHYFNQLSRPHFSRLFVLYSHTESLKIYSLTLRLGWQPSKEELSYPKLRAWRSGRWAQSSSFISPQNMTIAILLPWSNLQALLFYTLPLSLFLPLSLLSMSCSSFFLSVCVCAPGGVRHSALAILARLLIMLGTKHNCALVGGTPSWWHWLSRWWTLLAKKFHFTLR